MTAADFQRIALSLDGAEAVAHGGLPAFRVGGARFASLASQSAGYGNLTLTVEQQAAFVEEAPEIFLPIPGRKLTATTALNKKFPACLIHLAVLCLQPFD